MVILYAFLALLAGYATMAVIVVVFTVLFTRLAPSFVGSQGNPRPAYAAVNLGYSFAGAIAGGYVTTWIARGNPLPQTLVLALIVLLLGGLSALQMRGKQPVWYQLALMGISPFGVVAGMWVRMKVLGVL
jgi:hypothetical protein